MPLIIRREEEIQLLSHNGMGSPRLKHILGASIIVLILLFFLRTPVGLLFQSRTPFALSRDDIAPTNSTSLPQLIPKIIHQVYNIWSDGPIPEDWRLHRQSCIDLHPNYQFKVCPSCHTHGSSD